MPFRRASPSLRSPVRGRAPAGSRIAGSRRRGLLPEEEVDAPADSMVADAPALAALSRASVMGRSVLGRRPGAPVLRLGRDPDAPWVTSSGPCHAHLQGFDLHANRTVRAAATAVLLREAQPAERSGDAARLPPVTSSCRRVSPIIARASSPAPDDRSARLGRHARHRSATSAAMTTGRSSGSSVMPMTVGRLCTAAACAIVRVLHPTVVRTPHHHRREHNSRWTVRRWRLR